MSDTPKKYEFTGETKTLFDGTVVRQIRRLKDGAIGGWIEAETNLPQDLPAWIEPGVIACYRAVICDGVFRGGEFWGGEFWGGEFRGGVFRGGVFRGGVFRGGVFRGGEFRGGEFRGGEFWGGEFWGGEFWDGVFRGGEFWGGEFCDGEFWGGEFWGGEFRGGVFRGGVFEKPFDFIVVTGLRFQVTVQNNGVASIGCQTKKISDWLELKFEDQREMTNREEFDKTQAILRPIFEMFREPAAKTLQKEPT